MTDEPQGTTSEALGLVPPQSLECERCCLGAALIDRKAADEVLAGLTAEMFYHEHHRPIYNAVKAMVEAGTSCELVATVEHLRGTGHLARMGGASFVTQDLVAMIAEVTTARSVRNWIEVVRNCHDLRCVIDLADNLKAQAYGLQPAAEVVAYGEEALFTLGHPVAEAEPKAFHSELRPTLAKIAARRDKGRGIPTGLKELDELLGGLYPGEFGVVGARPSVGKTSLVTTIAANMVYRLTKPDGSPIKVLLFSLEMSADSLIEGILCTESGIANARVRKGAVTPDELTRLEMVIADLYDYPTLWIDDAPELTMSQIAAKTRRHVTKYGVDVVFVDYLQRVVRHKTEQRQSEREFISQVCRRMKTLARQVNVPVWTLSQLRREGSENPRPMLTGFMESGYIEAEADVAALLWRKNYQNREWSNNDPDPSELYIAKNRQGPTGLVPLMFEAQARRFRDPVNYEWTAD